MLKFWKKSSRLTSVPKRLTFGDLKGGEVYVYYKENVETLCAWKMRTKALSGADYAAIILDSGQLISEGHSVEVVRVDLMVSEAREAKIND